MTPPGAPELCTAMERTWCPAARWRAGPWMIRDGRGGGQRVSAATAEAEWQPGDIAGAEAEMQALGQPRLFMIRDGEADLDEALEGRGYAVVDPVVLYLIEATRLTGAPLPPVSAFQLWPPLAIMADLWAAGGIGPARLAVMERVAGPKTAILARHADRPAGVAFAALDGDIAMVHAIEVAGAQRRQGVGRIVLRAAAFWAKERGAAWLGLAVTRANRPANALYASLGMVVVGQYHYRKRSP